MKLVIQVCSVIRETNYFNTPNIHLSRLPPTEKSSTIIWSNCLQEKFQDKTSEYEIIYKTDIPMYEETKKEGNTIKYIYYDIYTLDKLDEIEIEG